MNAQLLLLLWVIRSHSRDYEKEGATIEQDLQFGDWMRASFSAIPKPSISLEKILVLPNEKKGKRGEYYGGYEG